MTDKPININNVDVKDCCYLREIIKELFCTCNSPWREDTVTKNSQCQHNPNCYFKQLIKCKNEFKKENERLKQGIKHYKRGMDKIISVANECSKSKMWNYKENE